MYTQTLLLSLEERDSEEIILVLRGYHKLLTDRVLPVHRERSRWTQDSGILHYFRLLIVGNLFNIVNYAAPPYHTRHTVLPAQWSFVLSQPAGVSTDEVESRSAHFADLSVPPPYHPPPPGFQVPLFLYSENISSS